MATRYRIGYFVGSLSSTSINRLLAKALVRLAPPALQMEEIAIKDLPLYSPDYDADYPRWPAPSSRPSPSATACCSSHPSTTARSPAV